MQIIKITPYSFKVILSKKDVEEYGASFCNGSKLPEQIFIDIIEKANEICDFELSCECLEAHFFESRAGGGELFVSKQKTGGNAYLIRTACPDSLYSLCKRLYGNFPYVSGRLYHDDKGYALVLQNLPKNEYIKAIIKDYASCTKLTPLKMWILEEHSKLLLCQNTLKTLARLS